METTQSDNITLRDILEQVKSQKSELKEYLDKRLSEVGNESADVALSEVKQLKENREITWNREGNKIQFQFNNGIIDDLAQALWAIQYKKLDYCTELINQALDKLKQRNKLIKIADSSEGGWDTVKEYISNPLASDSEDEKKISRAEGRAVRKIKDKQKKRKNAYEAKQRRSVGSNSTFTPSSSTMQVDHIAPGNSRANTGSNQLFRPQNRIGGMGACFFCGDFRHYRKDCPQLRPSGQTKQGS